MQTKIFNNNNNIYFKNLIHSVIFDIKLQININIIILNINQLIISYIYLLITYNSIKYQPKQNNIDNDNINDNNTIFLIYKCI